MLEHGKPYKFAHVHIKGSPHMEDGYYICVVYEGPFQSVAEAIEANKAFLLEADAAILPAGVH